MPPHYEGRLELTWTNKNQRLLTREDGSYEWVPPSDYRVAEVRLLHEAGVVGDVRPLEQRASDNLLIRGDALNALHSLTTLPEFSNEYVGQVKLVYIDPPFNTGQAFEQYDDALEHSVWLTMMRDRLMQVKRLLRPDGSVWVHLDDPEHGRLRVLMDEVFGPDNFVANVIWEKADSPRMDAALFSARHDHIVVYRKTDAWTPKPLPMDPEQMKHFNLVDEDGERYRRVLLRKWGSNSRREDRPNLWYPLEAPDGTAVWPIRSDGAEGYWRWRREKYEASKDSIEWVKQEEGWQPYVRQMARDATRRPPETIWFNRDVDSNRQAKQEVKALCPGVEPFATPKPERLLHRVIHIGSAPGDIVLDCFLGSGSTAAVAHKMGRRWVGVERSRETVETFSAPRLTKVAVGQDSGGITEEVGWKGGGGFRVLDVAPSMFEDDEGTVVIAEWAVKNKLAEATAAQFGYEYDSDPPFAGRKGRFRVAVIDGNVSADVVRLLAGALGPKERLLVCGTSLDPDAPEALRKLSPGSEARKVPASILADYQLAHRWQAQPTLPDTPSPSPSPDGAGAPEMQPEEASA